MASLLISYAVADAFFARRVETAMRRYEHDVWLRSTVPAFSDHDHFDAADFVLFILSPRSFTLNALKRLSRYSGSQAQRSIALCIDVDPLLEEVNDWNFETIRVSHRQPDFLDFVVTKIRRKLERHASSWVANLPRDATMPAVKWNEDVDPNNWTGLRSYFNDVSDEYDGFDNSLSIFDALQVSHHGGRSSAPWSRIEYLDADWLVPQTVDAADRDGAVNSREHRVAADEGDREQASSDERDVPSYSLPICTKVIGHAVSDIAATDWLSNVGHSGELKRCAGLKNLVESTKLSFAPAVHLSFAHSVRTHIDTDQLLSSVRANLVSLREMSFSLSERLAQLIEARKSDQAQQKRADAYLVALGDTYSKTEKLRTSFYIVSMQLGGSIEADYHASVGRVSCGAVRSYGWSSEPARSGALCAADCVESGRTDCEWRRA